VLDVEKLVTCRSLPPNTKEITLGTMSTTKSNKKKGGSKLSFLPKYLRNKYALTLLGFIIYIAFFDHYSLIKQHQLQQTLEQLQDEKAYYSQRIEESRELRRIIQADEEKFARVQYLMKRPNQDIFIVE